ncbi:unnamed protein product [Ascophyllum nodosum]
MNYRDEHEAFAGSRSSDYVYVPINVLDFATLDKHAETIEMDTKLPLVLVGETGIGKNALLSNWVKRRTTTKHRNEFLFQYFAGASTRAKQLSHMLHKLETALKEFFQLREMDVPSSEERLIWSLNRFLAAAAKKYHPARIVIVIDGIFSVKGLEMPAGALHWLPTELPAGVRLIVSTIANTGNGDAQKPHRTFVELLRRQCPVLMMEAMNGECQESIIDAFMNMHPNELYLTKKQARRIINLEVLSKPLYLRTLLYALRQGVALYPTARDSTRPTAVSAASQPDIGASANDPSSGGVLGEGFGSSVPDILLDFYLSSKNNFALTSKVLDMYAAYVDQGKVGANIMGAVLSVLYAARSGLMDHEIWGAAEIYLGNELSAEHKRVLFVVLKDNTMLVEGQRSFSHEEFRRVVYSKYIKSPDTMVRLHIQMARYFSRLPASDRKVECQPYHLEAAGCWSKLKNCLVDIDMFGIWWSPAHKEELVSLWVSFLLICLDLQSLGVPFLSVDEDGRSVLNRPGVAENKEAGKPTGVDQPPKPNEDFPDYTTYFYRRWMWIQFPWVALANCGEKYLTGIALKEQVESLGSKKPTEESKAGVLSLPNNTDNTANNTFNGNGNVNIFPARGKRDGQEKSRERSTSPTRSAGIATAVELSLPLSPGRGTVKPKRRKHLLIMGADGAEVMNEDGMYWAKMISIVRQEILDYKSELDALAIKRMQMGRKLKQVTDEADHMTELAGDMQQAKRKVARVLKKEEKVTRAHRHARLLARNYNSLLLMCDRHPPHSKLNSWTWAGDTSCTKRQKAQQAKFQQIGKEGKECEHDLVIGECGGTQGTQRWEEAWALIRASTGIADPDLFVQKHLNCDHLEIQMMELKQVSESRLNDLKKEIAALEEELEQTRCNSLSMSGNKEARDLHQRLNKAQARLKRSKERSDAVDELQRQTMTGFRHICELLGVPEHEEDIHVPEVARVAQQLIDRYGKSERSQSSPFPAIGSASTEAESAGGYVPNREAVKAKSAKTFRSEQRKQARLQKTLVFV